MKTCPLKRYAAPRYPTMSEARLEPKLLERLPRRWLASQPLATLTGAGLLARALLAQAEERAPDGAAPAAAALRPDRPDDKPVQAPARQVRRAATVIAPLLDEALAQDGRGSFGCVAVSPPVFLSENEALELIQTELEKAGLKLQDQVTVDGVEAPLSADPYAAMTGKEAKLGTRSYDFDLGDPGRSVVVEYFSRLDHDAWQQRERHSTVSSYDFPELMGRVSESFGKRKEGPPVVVGLFFDPLAHGSYRWGGSPDAEGLSASLQAFAHEQERASSGRNYEALKGVAREKLRRQVRHFVEHLQRTGVLPAGGKG